VRCEGDEAEDDDVRSGSEEPVTRTGEEIGETIHQRWRYVLIEEQLHSFATSIRCSRSAA
jgi:hypothetical protein